MQIYLSLNKEESEEETEAETTAFSKREKALNLSRFGKYLA